MKKEILILICICGFCVLCHGQNKKVDSLLQVLKIAKDDAGKVSTLNSLAYEITNNNPDTAIYFASKALALATELNDKLGIADAQLYIGRGLFFLGKHTEALKNCTHSLMLYDKLLFSASTANKSKILEGKGKAYNIIGLINDDHHNYPEALKNYFIALRIFQETGYKKGIAMVYSNIGSTYAEQGKYAEALKRIFTALKITEESGNKRDKMNILNEIGLIYWEQGNLAEALKSFFDALKINEELGDKSAKAGTLSNIGMIYGEQGNYAEALKNYLAALKIIDELDIKRWKAYALANIGVIYINQGKYEEALKNFFTALRIDEELADEKAKATCLGNIGTVYYYQGHYHEALKNHLASLKINEEIGDKRQIALSYNQIGDSYIQLKKYSEASRYLNKGLSLAKEISTRVNIRDTYRSLAELDSLQGNFKHALENYILYIAYRDSLVNKENTKKAVQIQMQYEFDKKESLAKLEQEKKDVLALKELQKQKLLKNFFIGGIGLVLVLFFLIYRTYRARQALRLYDIRNRIAGDLHDDIGSTLNSISIYSEVARKKDEHHDEALEMIGEASRKVIDAMSDIVWTINAENDSFAKIIFRMKSLAYNLFRAKKIEFTFHADEILNEKKLSLEERRNFYLIFKEAVNNLVKYSEATRVAITLTNENNWIKLRIQDNGVGFDTSQDNTGNGLKNMKRRAREMNAGFQIDSQIGKGTTIQLILNS